MGQSIADIGIKDVVILTVGVPIVVLPILYVAANLISVPFGNIIFGLTLITCFGWILLDFNVRDSGPKERQSILSRRLFLRDEVGTASHEQLRRMFKILLTLTGQVILGWGILLLLF